MTDWAYLGVAFLMGTGKPMQLALVSAMGRLRNARAAAWVSALGTFTALATLLTIGVASGRSSGLPEPFHIAPTIALMGCATGSLLYLSARRLPPYFAATGLFATASLIGTAFLVPKLGLAPVFTATTLGTVSLTLVVDHFGVMGVQIRRVNAERVIGVALVAAGTILVRLAG